MSHTALQQRPVSPRTRQEQQSRLWSLVLLLLVLGPPTLMLGAVLCALARTVRKPRAFAWLAIGGFVGLALLGWQWHTTLAELHSLRAAATPLASLIRPRPNHPVSIPQALDALADLWPPLWRLWRQAIVLAPMVASYIHSSKVKTAEEQERERAGRKERRVQSALAEATRRRDNAPVMAGGALILGVPIGGDLGWERVGYFTYPAAIVCIFSVVTTGNTLDDACHTREEIGLTLVEVRGLLAGLCQRYLTKASFVKIEGRCDTCVRKTQNNTLPSPTTALWATDVMFLGQPDHAAHMPTEIFEDLPF